MGKSRIVLFFVLGSMGVACAHRPTTYQPSAAAPPAVFNVPQQDPKGTIQVMSLGGERLATGDGAMFLHIRLLVQNRSDDQRWSVTPMDQVAVYDGLGRAAVAFAETNPKGSSPVLNLAAGQQGQLELYYPLPEDHDPPRVSVQWRVQRGSVAVTSAAVFDRASGRDAPAYGYAYAPHSQVYVGVGMGWWWYPGWNGYWGPGYMGRSYYGYGHGYGGYGPGRGYAPGYAAPAGGGGGWRGGGGGGGSPAPMAPSGGGGKSPWRSRR